jgi:hypothetical protein
MKRGQNPPPPPTPEERAKAREAAAMLRLFVADPSCCGTPAITHMDLSRPRRGIWLKTWIPLPGFAMEFDVGFKHALLPGWSYTREELEAEMIPDLERLAETGERPTEATR